MVGYKLCAGRLIEPRIVPPYIIMSFVTRKIMDMCVEIYLMVVAAQVYQHVIHASLLFPKLHHLQYIFSTDTFRLRVSGRWIRSMPWR